MKYRNIKFIDNFGEISRNISSDQKLSDFIEDLVPESAMPYVSAYHIRTRSFLNLDLPVNQLDIVDGDEIYIDLSHKNSGNVSQDNFLNSVSNERVMSMLAPETVHSMMTFLISIGHLAASELQQRWSLKHKQQSKSFPLSEIDQANTEIANMLEAYLAKTSKVELEQTLDLIKLKRELVYCAQHEKVCAKKEYRYRDISLHVLELRIKDCDKQIKSTLAEIDYDLQSIGLPIDKKDKENAL